MECNSTYSSPDGGLTLICDCCKRATTLDAPLPHAKNCQVEMPLIRLTTTESRVAKLIMAGYTAKEVGSQLGIAKATVDRHKRNVFHKLRVPNAIAMTALVMREQALGRDLVINASTYKA